MTSFAASSNVAFAQACPYLSLLHSIINTSFDSSFFSLSWSGLTLLQFMGLTLSLPVLDKVL